MEITFSKKAWKILQKLEKSEPRIFAKTQKKLNLFRNNPRHPSLRTHKLGGNLANSYSISVDISLRITYLVKAEKDGKKIAVIMDIGTHDEVYRK